MSSDSPTTEVWVGGEHFVAPADAVIEAGERCDRTPPTADEFREALAEVQRDD